MEGEFLAVVEEEERAAVLDAVMFWAHAELISYTVACAHEFGSFLVAEFVCLFDILRAGRAVYGCRHSVGDVTLV